MSESPRFTLMIVDDEPDVVAALRRALRNPRYTVLGCTKPEDALEILERRSVDLVISDLDMPGMYGLDLLRRIRRDHPGALRMVLTGRASLDSALDAINQGEVHRYLTKPWDQTSLRETIAAALERLVEVRATAAASHRAEQRAAMLAKLEATYPGITHVVLDQGVVVLDPVRLDEAWPLRAILGDGAPSAPPLGSDAVATSLESLAGRVIEGRYRLEAPIGSGGFGVVYRATQLSLERPVAVKLLRDSGGHPSRMGRFRVEALSTCRVVHPNAVTILDAGVSEDGLAYLAMELLIGETVGQRLARGATLDFRAAAALCADLCAALAVAHDAGILHRDIKPANVFMHQGPEGVVTKLLDFGIAKLASPRGSMQHLTAEDVIVGTPAYLAPERISGPDIDGRSDVYSVGVLLYDSLSGVTPFRGASPEEIVRQHLSMHPRPLVSLDPTVPPALDAIVRALLAKSPDDRPTASEAAGRLRALLPDLPTTRMRVASSGWASVTTEPDA